MNPPLRCVCPWLPAAPGKPDEANLTARHSRRLLPEVGLVAGIPLLGLPPTVLVANFRLSVITRKLPIDEVQPQTVCDDRMWLSSTFRCAATSRPLGRYRVGFVALLLTP